MAIDQRLPIRYICDALSPVIRSRLVAIHEMGLWERSEREIEALSHLESTIVTLNELYADVR